MEERSESMRLKNAVDAVVDGVAIAAALHGEVQIETLGVRL